MAVTKNRSSINEATISAKEFNDIASQNTAVSTQYSDKPLDPVDGRLVINETIIRQINRQPLKIGHWRAGHIHADSRQFPNRAPLYDMYDDILLDPHLSGIITKRLGTVLNKNIFFEKNGEKVEGNDGVNMDKLITSMQFRKVCRIILETQLWGVSGIEFIPGPDFEPRIINRKHINTKFQRITFYQDQPDGIDYTTLKNIFVVGEPEDLGLLLKCVPYIIYKRDGFADWGQFISIFGQPIRLMYYNANDLQAKVELKKTLDDSGGGLALMIPKGVEFDIKDGKQSNGNGALQKQFIDSLNAEVSILMLGNTETTTNGKTGSQAKSKTHAEQQDEISRNDINYLIAHLNHPQFLQILESYGFPVEGGRFVHSQDINVDYLEKRIGIDAQLPEELPVGDDYYYDTYGIPKPDDYATLKVELKKAAKIKKTPKGKPAGSSQEDLANLVMKKLKADLGFFD